MNRKRIFAFPNPIFFLTFLVWASSLCLPGEVFGQCTVTLPYSSGTNTFTVPAGITSITVEAWGGGGRGGTRTTGGEGGGGGGGGYSRSILTVTSGQSYTYVVGAGSGSTAAGGTSRFYLTSNSGTDLVRALGGNSVLDNSITGVIGGAASGGMGDTKFSGGNGADGSGNGSNRRGGGGGGGAGSLGGGTSGSGRFGGSNVNGGGDGGTAPDNNDTNGVIGTIIGGGGSGAVGTTRTGGSGARGQVTITYNNPTPTLSSAATASRCSNVSTTYTATSATAGTTFSWTRAAVAGISNLAASGAVAAATETLINTTANPVDVVYIYTLTANGCSNNQNVTVTVNPTPTLTSPLTAPACNNSAFTYLPTSAVSGATFTWTRAAVAGISNPAVTTAQTSNPNETLINTTTSPVNVIYAYVITANGCSYTQNVTVTVNPITAITTQPDNTGDSVCFGDGFSPISVSAVGGNLTYQWYRSPTGSNSGGIAIPSATSASFTPPSTPQGSMYYYVVVGGSCGSETSIVSGLYFVAPPITTIIQNPSSTAQNVCLNGTFSSISLIATGAGTISYQWYSNSTNTNSGGTLISGATNSSYTPLATTVGTTYYYATAKSDCGTVPTAVSGAFTVYPPPTVTNPASASTCSGAGPNISLTASVPSSFSWTIGTTTGSITGASAGSGATINQTLTNPSNATAGTVQYIVTPTSTTGSCPGVPYTITVTVNPTPAVTNPATATTCSGAGPNISLTASVPSSFSWTIGTTTGSITGASAGSGATINQTLTNPSNATAGTVEYIVTPTSTTGSCPGAPYTITVTVNPLPTVTNSTLTQTICSAGSTAAVTLTSGVAGTTFAWTATATAGVSGFTTSGSGPIPVQTISTTGTSQGTVTYIITPTANGCPGPTKNYTVLVNPQPTVTNSTLTQTICSGASTTLVTPTSGVAGTTFTWTASATAGVSGFTAGGSGPIPVQTILTTATTQGTVTYVITPTANGCPGPTTNYTVLVNPLATVGPTTVFTNNFPSVCITSPTISSFTRPTTGVSSIGVPTGLPPGISAVFNTTTKNIEFSGTVTGTTTGLYTYSIPLNGNCINGLTATGTIDVTPVYDITSVSSVSATTIGGTASVTFYGDPLLMLNGTYQIVYQIKQASGSFTTVGPVNATVVNGKGNFSTIPINSNVDTYTVQILSIKKSTDVCTITLPSPPTTYFGVCSAVFSGNSTFYVPANVYSITIEVYGGGGGGGNNGGGGGGGYTIRQNIAVTPGESIAVYVGSGGANNGSDGGVSYVSRDSSIPLPGRVTNSMVFANGGKGAPASGNALGGTFDPRYTGSNGNNATGNNGGKAGGPLGGAAGADGVNGSSPGGGGGKKSGQKGIGGNGLIIITYSCPDADNTDCIKVIDDGSKSGFTVLEFTCNYTWTAPEGLTEFTVIVGSGGGGGGSGFGSGGGGSGAIIRQTLSTTNPYGLPSGSSFPITVGIGGNGASGGNISGSTGGSSTFSGTINSNPVNISVPGGGGGGSQSSIPGATGASGGGGGARPNPSGQGGGGGNSIPITYTGTNVTIFQGNKGGNGEYSGSQNSIAGGGGGGLVAFVPADRPNGKAAGNGQGEGGDGGKGISLTLGDSVRYFGAGGGGIGEYFNGTEKVGIGGSANGVKLGGDGNLANPTAKGGAGRNKTGSGGGAGYGGGGKGGDGIVYISFPNVRILEVEYEYFTANYIEENRSTSLKWATTKEWENSHFEIERSVNGVTSWTKIGKIEGQGYSETTTEYSFTDTKLPAAGGIVYYRLKQVDFSGKFSYSVTKSIKVEGINGNGAWLAYPNPSSKRNTVAVDLLNRSVYNDEKIIIQISDIRGVAETFTVDKVESVSEVVNSYLDRSISGVYILQLIWGNNSQQLKLLRQ